MNSQLYLGAPGEMRELPIPDKGWNSSHKRFSSLARSVNGSGTEILLGSKRTYSLTFALSDETELSWLEQCWWGAVLPLWFIDPLISNRLPATTAASGGSPEGVRDFTATGGAMQVVRESAGTSFPRFGVKLVAGTQIAAPAVPVIAGERFTASARVHATQPVTPTVSFYNTQRALISSVSGSIVGSGPTYAPATVTATAPSEAATAVFLLRSSVAGDMTTTAWSLTPGGEPLWQPGGGAMEVTMVEFSGTTPFYPYTSVSIGLEQL